MNALGVRTLILLVILVGCGPKRPACPPTPALAPGPAFLWSVQRADGTGPTVWLFGTIHDAGIALVPPVVLGALDGAARFASELGDTEADPDKRRELSFLRSGIGIDQQLGDDWYDLRDTLRGKIREADLARARPWFALILLDNLAAPETVSMDKQLGERAADRHMPIDNLETFEDQMAMLDSVVSVEDLRGAIRSHHQLSCEFQMLLSTYARGDATAIEPMLVIPRTAEAVLYKRNRAWLPELEGYLAGTGAFVAVGLGHLLGDKGVPALLAKAGYTVTRIER